jgi:hypothetical protein
MDMNLVNFAERKVALAVDRLFNENPPRYGQLCVNPVTGGSFMGGLDPIEPQKEVARRALLARLWFADHGPSDAQPLPITCSAIANLKYPDPLSHIVSCFAYSLRSQDWDTNFHPSFDDFARGVMASKHAPEFVVKDKALQRRFPPRPLSWLSPVLVWEPPVHPPARLLFFGRCGLPTVMRLAGITQYGLKRTRACRSCKN